MFDEITKCLMEELAKYPDPNTPTAEQKFNRKLEFWESEYLMRKAEYESQTGLYEKEMCAKELFSDKENLRKIFRA